MLNEPIRSVGCRTMAPHRGGERGTIALAMVVLLICSALAGVLVTRNLSAGREGIRQEHRERALGAADVGFAASEARIAVGASSGFGLTGDVGTDSWTATVAALSPSEFDVTVTGTSGAWSRTVHSTVRRGAGAIEVNGWREVPGPTGTG